MLPAEAYGRKSRDQHSARLRASAAASSGSDGTIVDAIAEAEAGVVRVVSMNVSYTYLYEPYCGHAFKLLASLYHNVESKFSIKSGERVFDVFHLEIFHYRHNKPF